MTPPHSCSISLQDQMLRSVMQFILSVSLLAVALYVIVDPAAPSEAQKWAPGVIGTLIGYWLRGR
jgi:hypothetical protein